MFRVSKRKDEYDEIKATQIGLIAGGTGINPIYQIMDYVFRNNTQECAALVTCHLLFANHSVQDILLYHELMNMNSKCENLHVHLTVSRTDEEWKGEVGRVDEDMIRKYMPAPSDETVVLVCGPVGFVKMSIHSLKNIGHDAQRILRF